MPANAISGMLMAIHCAPQRACGSSMHGGSMQATRTSSSSRRDRIQTWSGHTQAEGWQTLPAQKSPQASLRREASEPKIRFRFCSSLPCQPLSIVICTRARARQACILRGVYIPKHAVTCEHRAGRRVLLRCNRRTASQRVAGCSSMPRLPTSEAGSVRARSRAWRRSRLVPPLVWARP